MALPCYDAQTPNEPTYEVSANDLGDPNKFYCGDCKDMVGSWPWTERKHQAVPAMRHEKCPLCKFLLETLELEHRATGSKLNKLITLYPWADEGDPHAELTTARRPITDITDDVIKQARNWLQECSAKHRQCGEKHGAFLEQPVQLPRRVLRLDEEEGYFRIHESKADEKDLYATLSYVWGPQKGELGKEKSKNEASGAVKNGEPLIATATLPQAFQDAIELTLKLGFNFLWIHALCVLKDDPKDQRQAERDFLGIYKNAAVCIRLGNIRDIRKSFLANDDPYLLPPACTVRFIGAEGSQIALKLTTKDLNFGNGVKRFDGSLFSRAWPSAEAFVSPRQITITAFNEITYYCDNALYEKDKAPGLVKTLNDSITKYSYCGITNLSTVATFSPVASRMWYWEIIVRVIGESETSRPEDRLTIIDNIARDPIWKQGDYMFGFWKRDARRDLLWTVFSGRSPDWSNIQSRRLRQAPTWSWGSVTAPIRYLRANYIRNWQFRLIDWTERAPLKLSLLSRKVSGIMRLEGKVTSRERLIQHCGKDYLFLNKHEVDCSDEFDELNVEETFVLLVGQVYYGPCVNRDAGASKGMTISTKLENTSSNSGTSIESRTDKETKDDAKPLPTNDTDKTTHKEQKHDIQGNAMRSSDPVSSGSNEEQTTPESYKEVNSGFSEWLGGFPKVLGTRKHHNLPTRQSFGGAASKIGQRLSTSAIGMASSSSGTDPTTSRIRRIMQGAHKTETETTWRSSIDDEYKSDTEDWNNMTHVDKYRYSEDLPFRPRKLSLSDNVEMLILKQVSKNVYERVALISRPCQEGWISYWHKIKLTELYLI